MFFKAIYINQRGFGRGGYRMSVRQRFTPVIIVFHQWSHSTSTRLYGWWRHRLGVASPHDNDRRQIGNGAQMGSQQVQPAGWVVHLGWTATGDPCDDQLSVVQLIKPGCMDDE